MGNKKLTDKEIASALEDFPGWIAEGGHISKTFNFPNFKQALAFVNTVGELAEKEDHHPEIELSWGKADIALSTHEVGGITEKDIRLARKIERL